ncbi:hypothetical protein [Metabacillus arenae]|uniref:Uncharacterized protein n=1 Tax=Metabacillus arenae TaxID=2771434 RepID=A0A926NJ87_9BACI|nr:hypothetical protein [Metabacillus arenae]MBD1379122.1 hypothetical protein [Metabacillus arenae]
MEQLIQGSITLDFFTRVVGDEGVDSFIKMILTLSDNNIRELNFTDLTGETRTLHIQGHTVDNDDLFVSEIDEFTPEEYKK